MPSNSSDVELLWQEPGETTWTDIAAKTLITKATFSGMASAQPSDAEFVLKDPDRTLDLHTGGRLRAIIDGVPMYSGYGLQVAKGDMFPAGDGKARTATLTRQWTIRPVDRNILWDKRVFYNPANPLVAPADITTPTMDGALIRQALADYGDWGDDGLDLTSAIDDVRPPGDSISSTNPWGWPEGGTYFRELMEDMARWSGAVYYIGADDKIHYHALQDVVSPWGFSDVPMAGTIVDPTGFQDVYVGFREVDATDDGSQIVRDAFVWGGGPPVTDTPVFARSTDTAVPGPRWQYAETHLGEKNYKTAENVQIRANMIVFGNPDGDPSGAQPGSVAGEGPRGLRYELPSYQFTWFGRDIPYLGTDRLHLRPGWIVPIQLTAFGGVIRWLPLRQVKVAFYGAPNGKAHVEFRGLFDLRNEDPFTLWKFLRQKERKSNPTFTGAGGGSGSPVGAVDNTSTSSTYGDIGQFTPLEAIDGTRTVFSIPFGYILGSTQVFLNGLLQRRGIDYFETSPETGTITMTSPPKVAAGDREADELFIICRTRSST